jgi:hypothetical protein
MPEQTTSRVIRANTPPRNAERDEHRETLWRVTKADAPAVSAVIVGLVDAVELEVFVGNAPRRTLRFLRDTGARSYADRLRQRLTRRGFNDR